MKIKELSLQQYGPIKDAKYGIKDFTIIQGNNESGKTLTIDALVKLMFKDKDYRKAFPDIDRVEHDPTGYVLIEANGKTEKLDRSKHISDIGLSINSKDYGLIFRNVFISRNSLLEIELDDFKRVTDQLTGLRTGDIEDVVYEINKICNLTPSGDIKNDSKTRKLRDRCRYANDVLLPKVDALLEKITSGEYETIEKRLSQIDDEVNRVNESLNECEEKRSFKNYQDGKRALESLIEQTENLAGFKAFSEKDYALWRASEKKQVKVERQPSGGLTGYESTLKKIVTILGLMAVPLILLSITLFAITDTSIYSLLSTGLTVIVLALLGVFGILFYLSKTEKPIEQVIPQVDQEVIAIKKKTGITSLDEYNEKLKQKEELTNKIEGNEKLLLGLFGGDTAEDRIAFWSQIIEKIGKSFEGDVDTRGYEDIRDRIKELEDDRKGLNEEKQSLLDSLSELGEDFGEIQRRINDVLDADETIFCETTAELREAKNKLDKFINATEVSKEDGLRAIQIFNEIATDEKSKIKTLFGKDSPVSKYFRHITSQKDTIVEFDSTGDKIIVRQGDLVLNAKKLSKGAFDQLHFAIRLALGEKLLSGGKGFFILDDPFIASDKIRLKNQLELLKRVVANGWQIVYFTAKDEIAETLKSDIKKGHIEHINIS